METIKLKFDNQQLQELKKQFTVLCTIREKLDFWDNKLNRSYVLFDRCFLDEISDFIIRPKDSDETFELNRWLLSYATLKYQDLKGKIYSSYETMVSTFEKKAQTITNLKNLISHELDLVKNVCEEKSKAKHFTDATSNFFKAGYDNFYLSEIEPDLSERTYETLNLLALMYGYNLAKYRRHLEELQSSKMDMAVPKKETKLNLNQQILILDYLGVMGDLGKVKSKKADFLAPFFGLNPQYIREHLSEFQYVKKPNSKTEKIKIKKELEYILQMFAALGSKKIVETIQTDIRNIGL